MRNVAELTPALKHVFSVFDLRRGRDRGQYYSVN